MSIKFCPEGSGPADPLECEPLVSVIIPCYNRSKIVGRAIHSVLAQSVSDWEMVIVDDASTDSDELQAVIGNFDDSRIRLIRHETNSFAAAARNTGVREARGTFVAFLDSDDEWLSEKLEKQLDLVGRDPSRDCLVHACAEVLTTRGGREHRSEMPVRPVGAREAVADYLFLGRGYLPTPSVMMPRRLALTHPFPEHLRIHEDYAMFFALERSGVKFLMPEGVLLRVHWQEVAECGRNLDPAASMTFAAACKDSMSSRARSRFILNQIVISLARNGRKSEAWRHFVDEVRKRDLGVFEWMNTASHFLFGDARLPVWCSHLKKRIPRSQSA
jgi:glycosyltransferase involved in cell wall biosynthesis